MRGAITPFHHTYSRRCAYLSTVLSWHGTSLSTGTTLPLPLFIYLFRLSKLYHFNQLPWSHMGVKFYNIFAYFKIWGSICLCKYLSCSFLVLQYQQRV